MLEYKGNEKEMMDLIMTDEDETKWIRTGDLEYIDEQGFLFLLGRMKRFIFIGPEGMIYKVSPKKIEDIIVMLPDVLECCVVSEFSGKNYVVKAFVVLKESRIKSTEMVEEDLKKTCSMFLSDYLCPSSYEFLEMLPKTSVGKIDYCLLEEMEENRREKL